MQESEREAMREATIAWILAARWEYLGTTGCNVLRHWDQIQDRVRAASRMADDVPSWTTNVARALSLGAPAPERAKATGELAAAVGKHALAWLDLVEEEHGYLMACARLNAEARSAKKKAARDAREPKPEPIEAPEPSNTDDVQASIFD